MRTDRTDAVDLASYRYKYALARADAGLQELHRLHPALHVLDDHEVENNYSDNLPPPQPLQRYAGYRAASEWIPRVVNKRDRFRIYRRVPLNANAELFLIDTRQYRQGSADGRPRSILGPTQMAWLLAALKSSTARWKIIVQQMPVSRGPDRLGRAARTAGTGSPRTGRSCSGRSSATASRTSSSSPATRTCSPATRLASNFDALGEGTRAPLGGRVHRRIGHVARPRQARGRGPRRSRPGVASTTAASTATRSSPSTRRTW